MLERNNSNHVSDASTIQEVHRQRRSGESSGTSPVEGILCSTCNRTNARDRTFCSDCGRSLWEACPKCEAQYVVGETFCGSCGGNLPQMVREQLEAYKARLDEAVGFGRKHEYETAISRLRSVAKVNDARYQQVAQRAAQLIDELTDRHERRRAHAETACRKAQKHLSRHDYEATVKLLESVPLPMRDDQARGLLHEAKSALDEVRLLRDGIREAAKQNRLFDLSMKIDRLLALKPHNEQAKRLAGQLSGRLLRAAQTKISEHDYGEAVSLLDQVPSAERAPKVEKLAAHAAELNWLMTDLKLAAVADEQLVAIAERLLKHCPDNKEAESLEQQIKRRAIEKPSDPRYVAPDWSIPRRPHLGFPVDWLGIPQRIQGSSKILDSLRKAPGQYFVACGLALQGIGRASVDITLASQQKSGVLHGFSLRRKKTPSRAWGLDAGASSLIAVHLHFDEATRQVTIDAVDRIDHKKNLLHAHDDIEKRALLQETFAQFVERNEIRGDRMCLSISGQLVLGRIFDLPQVDDKRLDQLLSIEASHRLPVPLADLALGYKVLDTYDGERHGHPQMRVALQAVKSFHVEQLLATAGEAGLNIDVLQSDCTALHNFAIHEFFGNAGDTPEKGKATKGENDEAIAMLDVGAHGSNLVISSPTLIWFRSLGVGGDAFTGDLLKPFRLTRDQAEALKRKPTKARRISQVYKAIGPTLSCLIEDVQRSIQSYSKLFPDVVIRQMFGVGGGFALHGLMRRLRNGH